MGNIVYFLQRNKRANTKLSLVSKRRSYANTLGRLQGDNYNFSYSYYSQFFTQWIYPFSGNYSIEEFLKNWNG